MDNNELTHWGVKGMRWGIRRYQNKDGTLTPAGNKRLKSKGEKVKTDKILKKTNSSKKSYHSKKIIEMSDSELREKINRLQMEKQLKDLISSSEKTKRSKGKDFVMGVLEQSGKNIATQAATYVIGKGVNNTLGKMLNDTNMVNPKKGQKDK